MSTHTIEANWKVGYPTVNGRLYTFHDMQKAIEEFLWARDFGRANRGGWISDPDRLGRWDYPIEQMSHVVTDLRLYDDGSIEADIETLRSTQGQVLDQLLISAKEEMTLNIGMVGRIESYEGTNFVRDIRIDFVNVTPRPYEPLNK